MVVVVGVLQRVSQDKVRLHATINIGQTEQRLFIGAQRIIADIKELDAGAEDIGGGLRLLLADLLHRLFGHVAFAPQFGRFATLAERQADNMDLVALAGVQGNRPASAPDEIGRVGADDKGTFFAMRMRHDGFLCCFFQLVMSRGPRVIR